MCLNKCVHTVAVGLCMVCGAATLSTMFVCCADILIGFEICFVCLCDNGGVCMVGTLTCGWTLECDGILDPTIPYMNASALTRLTHAS